ncbi:hypothetical protein LTR36_010680 [Oleoguttula mirabilis]|uniref:Flavin-containing monooxygenase n=1 Tax=Oleoguttula mirabilis TaxID=1507867 RepID=A0AAV9JR81_9PEZI|nr:hypothetical protein LTR36_010680 [Oleoguttula mirabilis]
MKTVCIVGAGPAGLVAAKIFLQTGQFAVTIYEKNARLGGIWALDEDTVDGLLSPHTPTNLSRFTVAFSDLDWRSVNLQSTHDSGVRKRMQETSSPPMFPKAWQVNRYLEAYKQKYIPDGVLHHQHEVVKAERAKPLAQGANPFWRITIKDKDSQIDVREFDYLLVASGFFSKPRPLKQDVPGLAIGEVAEHGITAVHSSQLRSVDDLFPSPHTASGKQILLIGGGNSSGEAAAAVAMQLSDAQWSPDKARQKLYQGCGVKHVLPRSLYPLPPYIEYEPGSRAYVPIDLKLYDFSKRLPGPIEAYAGQQAPEVRTMVHEALQKIVGGDQSDLGSAALVSPKGEDKGTVYVALSESYAEFVRSGMIDPVTGRVTEIIAGRTGSATAIVMSGDNVASIENIGAIVYATGYTPSAALDFLADDVKKAFQFDPNSMRMPLILEQWQTINEAVPIVAFLGFYEGPYWPMVEMQARLTAERWLHDSAAPRTPFEESGKLLQLREAMRRKANDVPQYWFGDYLGYMENVASHLGLEKNDGAFKEREGCPSPARYLAEKSERGVNDAIMQDLHQTWRDCIDNGKYVARAAFRAMQGDWNISRRIVSKDQNYSGTLEGQASFHPRFPTQDRSCKAFALEYLYVESGSFRSASGLEMRASRRYVYRYSELDDELSVWFVKPDKDLEVDYLFHGLAFMNPAEARKAGACIAKADHLCVDDMYWTHYTLPLKGVALQSFEVKHTVKGPNKDYVATTQYSRPLKGAS